MAVLLLFAFIGGIVTILSPCILPILPIILSSSVEGNRKRPHGVVMGFVVSFTFFTVALSTLVKALGLSADSLRTLAVVVIFLFGLVMVVPALRTWWEFITGKFLGFGITTQKPGYGGGFLIGLSLGLVWAPCVGPIMASVITLAATGLVSGATVLTALAYSIGTAIPMVLLMYGGQRVIATLPAVKARSHAIQRFFGLLMIATAIMIAFGWDRRFQVFILETFPNYGTGLTALEDNRVVQNQLEKLKDGNMEEQHTAPELTGYTQWVNSEPLLISELTSQGKVVLIDFWTYSCVNCIRTLPYLQAWHEKYADKGLVIIGVHAPEFEFEKKLSNVQKAINDFGLTYPVVQDNDFTIWRAYDNHYWPAKYVIDKSGKIRYTSFGEGKYDQTERMIQQLLGEEAKTDLVTMPVHQNQTRSPETYLGYWRMERMVSPQKVIENTKVEYWKPRHGLKLNEWSFEGEWMVGYQHAQPAVGSKLAYVFDAKEVNLVMRTNEPGSRVRILLDGEEVKVITIEADQLYPLVTLEQPGEHVLELQFLDPGIEVYAFTFG
jgi:cytochrome c biogenesis protein CcdA/thiol-disulfide isomerase/thioredoxin